MKMPPIKSSGAKMKAPATRSMDTKPHIRMQKLKPGPPGAFPQSAAAFPPDGSPPGPDQAMASQPGGMSPGAAPGDMGE